MLNDNSLNGAPDAVGVAGKRGVATLGERLDEAAIEVRGATAGRISLTLAGALLCLLLIPFRQAAIWFGVSAVIEAWSWSATRCHGGREPAGGPARWSFAGSYLAQQWSGLKHFSAALGRARPS